jgi:hypothetical protein
MVMSEVDFLVNQASNSAAEWSAKMENAKKRHAEQLAAVETKLREAESHLEEVEHMLILERTDKWAENRALADRITALKSDLERCAPFQSQCAQAEAQLRTLTEACALERAEWAERERKFVADLAQKDRELEQLRLAVQSNPDEETAEFPSSDELVPRLAGSPCKRRRLRRRCSK